MRHGQGQDYLLSCAALTGEEAERIGLVSPRCGRRDQATERAVAIAHYLADLPATAAGSWVRVLVAQLVPPEAGTLPFDASLGYEFFGFPGLPEARQGLVALKEKRPPYFRAAQVQTGSSKTSLTYPDRTYPPLLVQGQTWEEMTVGSVFRTVALDHHRD